MEAWRASLLIGAGAAVGANLRYWAGRAALALGLAGWPLATLAINVSGSLALGVLAGLGVQERAWLLAGVGALGAYTTFSTFALEAVQLIEAGDWRGALLYGVLSPLLSIVAAALGLRIGRGLL